MTASYPRVRESTVRQLLGAYDEAALAHGSRVALEASRLGAALLLSEDRLEAFAVGARLHDVGKAGVP